LPPRRSSASPAANSWAASSRPTSSAAGRPRGRPTSSCENSDSPSRRKALRRSSAAGGIGPPSRPASSSPITS
jgi:hypothetical protein